MPLAPTRSRPAPARTALPPLPDHRLATLAAMAAGMGGLIFLLFQQGYAIEALQHELAARPPVAVIDYAPITAAIAEGRTPEEIEPLFRRLKAMSETLQAAGFVVLNRTAVDAAPAALVVSVDALTPRTGPASSPPPQALPPAPAEPIPAAPGLSDAEARALIGVLTAEPRR